ncbi:MAG: endopeptidase La [bacterium JZ-2024 1]
MNLKILPLIPLRGMVVFPRMMTPIVVGRQISLLALKAAEKSGNLVFLVAQKNPRKEEVSIEDLYEVGTICKLSYVGQRPDGKTQALVEGLERARRVLTVHTSPFFSVQVETITPPVEEPVVLQAILRQVRKIYESLFHARGTIPFEILFTEIDMENPEQAADTIAAQLNLSFEQKQEILQTIPIKDRLQLLLIHLSKELAIYREEKKIENQVREKILEPQRQAYLREQLKAIQKELGEKDAYEAELDELRKKFSSTRYPAYVREKALKEIDRLKTIPPYSPEYTVARTYVDWLAELPWKVRSRTTIDISRVQKVLDEDHYGLEEPKERICEHLAVKKLARGKMSEGAILCFVGPPGVGKTSLAQSIARALKRKYVRISLGGVRDEAEIRGHRRTYVGALPGKIIQAMKKARSKNPVFLIDEVDKIGADFRGDPSAALLEVLDPDQNHSFTDHYLELPFDLSEVLFICTANVDYTILPPLLDRMEVIHLSSYTEEEKVEIARRHLVRKVLKKLGMEEYRLEFPEETLRLIIRLYTREAGVRNLEKMLAKIVRKIAQKIARKESYSLTISPEDVKNYLGPPQFLVHPLVDEKPEIGVAYGLAWTEVGGSITPVETKLMPGKGELILTGRLGEVMKESAIAALSFIRNQASLWNIDPDFRSRLDIHIHVPEGAIPKDGPSAGITILLSLLSALIQKPLIPKLAMTGEITLRGKILPVGGIKEKVLAAYREGFTHILLPLLNQKDLEKVPEEVKKHITFHFVDTVDLALRIAFPPSEKKEEEPVFSATTPAFSSPSSEQTPLSPTG